MDESIDEVIERLDGIVAWARAEKSRVGYFAAMYAEVTKEIKRAIEAGEFQNAERMGRFDVVFARRYIDAFDAFGANAETTAAWKVAFDAASRWRPIVVQQLLVGMNAHINLDLGIAAATVASGADFDDLHPDFDKINEVLARMTDRFVGNVEAVSPWIKLLDRIGGRAEEHVIKFSIDVARDEAWKLASELAPLPPDQWAATIDARDDWSAGFARFLLGPGRVLRFGLFVIRLRESNDVVRVIDLLAGRTG